MNSKYMIRILGTAWELFDEAEPPLYFEDMDSRTGELFFTDRVEHARTFETKLAAIKQRQTIPSEQPVRMDGLPNRPLSGFTVEIAPTETDRESEGEESSRR